MMRDSAAVQDMDDEEQIHPGQRRPRSSSESTPLLGAPSHLTRLEPLPSYTVAAAAATTDMENGDGTSNKKTFLVPPQREQQASNYSTLPFFSKSSSSENSNFLKSPIMGRNMKRNSSKDENNKSCHPGNVLVYLVYALVNVIIAVPGLYGYAAVIFNHSVFQPHMNALAKLVIFSSLVHQLGFLLFSSLDFAIGTVQDAGLIFLSSMSNVIANRMLEDNETDTAIVSTTLVLLSAGTALLGLCLFAIGKFQLANAVAYLPMPVIGGYLAFIGYFCIQAGVALCISTPLISFFDWKYLFQGDNFLLALPGLLAALVLTLVSRLSKNDAILPLCMVTIPALFYLVIFGFLGWDMDQARDAGWVGQVAPPTPIQDVVALIDFSLVRWDLVGEIMWTWAGMVFVVSFASCLDVAAISMDMGEALDTNRELATVGICNFMSGLTFGFTGSYIFSQTIFTFRTGVHSRWIGTFIMAIYLYFVISPMNLLQISPLFFLGSTLIFIGYDLVFEWLYEIRLRILWSEYATIWGTFVAIQIVGVDAGILIGVLFCIVEHVVANAQATSVHQVRKRSRAIWSKDEYQFLHDRAYNTTSPKIVTMEIVGPVFFGSSLSLLDRLREEVALTANESSEPKNVQASPHTSSFLLTKDKRPSFFRQPPPSMAPTRPPKFCVLDLTQVSNMDASAARSCFLQFSKLCQKKGMTVCATGATPRIEWMLRSHEAAYETREEEEKVKATLQASNNNSSLSAESATDKMLLFFTVQEALEFCEATLIHQFHINPNKSSDPSLLLAVEIENDGKLSSVFAKFLGSLPEEAEQLKGFDTQRYHDEVEFNAGEKVVSKESRPESLYVVLSGAVASGVVRSQRVYKHKQRIVSGAGLVENSSFSNLVDICAGGDGTQDSPPVIATLWPVGGVFGYSDLLLDRPRTFTAFATKNETKVARITRSNLNLLQQEDPALNALLHRVLLKASVFDLANCTCDDV
eukprot:CAMPEP_0172466436 /NCGR_PEP_ID=MMETSP1065-20121228/56134_1 /TAXON_ID=265537 /ORGANISM="Amphiprora paludosa, Strain CCMP125" /LENGTH=974 /DNA_ID=CAMNT_0013223237 /DNA_START=140 /DNA_END=3064 /DNA_ORIENTATION=+